LPSTGVCRKRRQRIAYIGHSQLTAVCSYTAGAGDTRDVVYRLNYPSSDNPPSRFLGGEQILQVADVGQPRRTTMEQNVRNSNQATIVHSDVSMHRLFAGKESLSGFFRDSFR
jgi:hypothetical protein